MVEDLGMYRTPIIVEFHGEYNNSAWPQVMHPGLDVTEFVVSISWTSSVDPPYETITLTMNIPRHAVHTVIPGSPTVGNLQGNIQPGFWIVVRDLSNGVSKEQRTTLTWGRVSEVNVIHSVQNEDGVLDVSIQIQADSWVNHLKASQFKFTTFKGFKGEDHAIKDSLLNLQEYYDVIKARMEVWKHANPGPVLEEIYKLLAKNVRLPSSIAYGYNADAAKSTIKKGGWNYSEQVPVAHDTASLNKAVGGSNFTKAGVATAYIETVFSQENSFVEVMGRGITSISANSPEPSVWDVISASFYPDPSLMELFPYMHYPEPGSTVGKDSSLLATGLNANPMLVYRMKPYLSKALNQESIKEAWVDLGQFASVDVVPQDVLNEVFSEQLGVFQDPLNREGVTTSPAYFFNPEQVFSINYDQHDGHRINCVSVRSSVDNSTAQMGWGMFNEPIYAGKDIFFHGMRHYEVSWPYFPEKGTALTHYIMALTEFAANALMNDGSHISGTAQVSYSPRTRAGHYVAFNSEDAVTEELSRGIFRGTLTGYAETVTHNIEMFNDGSMDLGTSITFSRGYSELRALKPGQDPRTVGGSLHFYPPMRGAHTKAKVDTWLISPKGTP